MWTIAYRKQLTGDNGDKRLSPWPSFGRGSYESKAQALTALMLGRRRIVQDGIVYFGAVMRTDDLLSRTASTASRRG